MNHIQCVAGCYTLTATTMIAIHLKDLKLSACLIWLFNKKNLKSSVT